MRNPLAASMFAVSLLALTACTPKISKASLESTITSTFAKQDIKLKSVTCPGDRPLKAGDKFECQGELEEGDKATIKVEQKDGKGSLAFDIVGGLVQESMVGTFLSKQEKTKVDAKCPKKLTLLLPGKTEVCDLTAGADKGKVTITGEEKDRVNFKVAMDGKPAEAPAEGEDDKPIDGEAVELENGWFSPTPARSRFEGVLSYRSSLRCPRTDLAWSRRKPSRFLAARDVGRDVLARRSRGESRARSALSESQKRTPMVKLRTRTSKGARAWSYVVTLGARGLA